MFVKFPKKVGDMVKPNYGESYTEGWGILLEEGVRFHRFLFAILLGLSLAGILYVVWRGNNFGVQSPSILELVGVGGLFTAIFALFCTVWYQWAETG